LTTRYEVNRVLWMRVNYNVMSSSLRPSDHVWPRFTAFKLVSFFVSTVVACLHRLQYGLKF